jgi:hypothetical protein
MITLNLVKVTDTSGGVTGVKGKVTYQALTDKEEDNLLTMEGGYSHIGRDFTVEMLGAVQIPSIGEEE